MHHMIIFIHSQLVPIINYINPFTFLSIVGPGHLNSPELFKEKRQMKNHTADHSNERRNECHDDYHNAHTSHTFMIGMSCDAINDLLEIENIGIAAILIIRVSECLSD